MEVGGVDVAVGVAVFVGVLVGVRVNVAVGVGEAVAVGVGVLGVAVMPGPGGVKTMKLNASTSLPESPQVLPSKYRAGE